MESTTYGFLSQVWRLEHRLWWYFTLGLQYRVGLFEASWVYFEIWESTGNEVDMRFQPFIQEWEGTSA